MKVIKAPKVFIGSDSPVIFLAGSIEMDTAEKWQDRLESELQNATGTILNPRRDDWDSSWIQSKDDPQFREQVEWELRGMERADLILVYFSPPTKGPITLLELGLFCRRAEMIVCCPEGFWRKGNVDIVCERYRLPQVATLDELITRVKQEWT